jgi:hypothetical protein
VSQTITPGRPGGGGPAAPAPAAAHADVEQGPIGRVVVALQRGLEGTPGRLRIAAGVAILAAIVAGLGGGAALRERSSALEEARENAATLALLQGVRTNLGQADADAANAFLTFGLEPAEQQRDYIASLQAASRDLTKAARGVADTDAALLGHVNDQLTQYAGYIESARTNNRQGVTIGASYLTVASTLMREQILETLGRVADNEARRTDEAYDRAGGAMTWLVVSAVLGVGALLAVQVWLAGRSRRVLNPPAALATGALLVILVGAGTLMAVAQHQADEARDGPYARAAALGQARVAAFDAKSREALTLVQRGSGEEADPEWRASFDAARSAVERAGGDSTLTQPLLDYEAAHQKIRELDQAGDWDGAVELAITPAATPGSANGTFTQFADASRVSLEQASEATDDGLDEARGGLTPMSWLVVLVGLVAAGGAWWGISLRLDEYR